MSHDFRQTIYSIRDLAERQDFERLQSYIRHSAMNMRAMQ